MARILVVTKDIGGGFNTLLPVLKGLDDRGHETMVFAEGGSRQKWFDAGRTVFNVDHLIGEFDKDSPDAVIAELASPIGAASLACAAANVRGVPLIFVEDLWGVHARAKTMAALPVIPQLICAFDGFSADMAKRNFEGHPVMKIVVTGNPAMDALVKVKPNGPLQDLFLGGYARGKRIVVALGQDESTTPMLEGLVAALERVGNYILIPRFHPKWMTDPSKAEHCRKWHSILDGAKKGAVMWLNNENTQEIMSLAHNVVSIYSTGLVEAAMLGTIPVVWNSPLGQEKMAASLGGLTRFPLVETGAAIEVSSPEEYLDRVPQYSSRVGVNPWNAQVFQSQRRVPSDGKNTRRVVQAICDLLKK